MVSNEEISTTTKHKMHLIFILNFLIMPFFKICSKLEVAKTIALTK